MSHHDVVVIGTGTAGLAAAVPVAEAGARVLVIAKGIGATHLSPGTIDVLGYTPARVERPLEAMEAWLDARPDHPYGLVGPSGVGAAVAWFKDRMAGGSLAPYAYVGDARENLLLPTAVGVPRPSAVVPETMARGDLRDRAPVCVVGFRSLKDFHPALLADNLARSDAGVQARAVELDLAPERRADVNALGFARGFDDPAFRHAVVAQLASRLRADERVAFPAVLGIADPHGTWTALEHELGRPVFEVPTLPPSVPGMRVFAVLREALRRAGGAVVLNNVVVGAERDGDHVRALRVRVGLRAERRGADQVVLATGGFAAGGLELDSRWKLRETALGLPVTGAPEAGQERFRAGYFDEQPMARAGVAADHELRPLDASGDPVLSNVLVAGATLAGAEPWREKSGEGLSLSTGHRAAQLVLAAARPSSGTSRAVVGG
jgi:glycerol-3-phosphate dehydrogenase subunit B